MHITFLYRLIFEADVDTLRRMFKYLNVKAEFQYTVKYEVCYVHEQVSDFKIFKLLYLSIFRLWALSYPTLNRVCLS